jgi:DNA-binding LacI/PurR family transcriptional regulator
MITVREIAEFAGVSKSTVSLALNNRPGVSDQMRKTVFDARAQLEAMQTDNLQPQASGAEAQATYQQQACSIMVLHPPVLRSSHVFSEVLQGIQSSAELCKAQLRLVANNPQATEHHVSNLYLTDEYLRPDGVIVFGAEQNEPVVDKIVALNIPCVVLGREAQKYPVSGIQRDEAHHAYVLTKHLIDLNHQRIAFVGGEAQYDYTNNRVSGYKKALAEANIQDIDRLVHLGNGAQATQAVLDAEADLTAIVFVNDTYAIEGITVLENLGLSIPDDMSIVSFDNTKFAQTYKTPLTSIAYNHYKEGQWSVKILLDEIRHPFIRRSTLEFDGELIIRKSTQEARQYQLDIM